MPVQTKAEILADAQAAADKLRKTFEMSQNGHTNGKVLDPIAEVEKKPTLDAYEGQLQTPEQPQPFRAKNARPLESEVIGASFSETQERLTAQIAAQTAKLDEVLKRMVSGPEMRARIGSATPPSAESAHAIAADISDEREYGRLKAELLKNGDMSFSLPFDAVRSSVGFLAGEQREAFREVGRGMNQHLEVTGDSNRQIRAAFEYAKQRWNGEAIVIKVGDRDRDRIVHHAVAAGMTIDTSGDVKLAEAVAAEQKRQSIDKSQRLEVPIIERAVKHEEKKAAAVGMAV